MVKLATASRLFCLTLLMHFETSHMVAAKWFEQKYSHRPKSISVDDLKKLALYSPRTTFETLLDPILTPRVSGTPEHAKVKQYLINHLKNLKWTVETDAFEDITPFGTKNFENIIATLNPDVHRRLVLACHYDSKYMRDYDFIGATDSAVPCAMLLHLAESLQHGLNNHKDTAGQNVTLQLIFFDGEEAFVEWSLQDSIYGARHLAEKWEDTPYVLKNQEGGSTNSLHRIDVMVLLDLLGVANPKIFNFFQSTSNWHNLFVEAEEALKKNRLWSGRTSKYFQNRQSYGGIEDDHIPFLRRKVSIVHVIPTPFPTVWHTRGDNKAALDFPTIDNLNKILRIFVARYLHLDTS